MKVRTFSRRQFGQITTAGIVTSVLPFKKSSAQAAINIDVGRQLFVDDYLIASRVGLTRNYYRPVKYGPALLRPTMPWEGVGAMNCSAMPFSGGVWWNTTEQRFWCYYLTGDLQQGRSQALAVSSNGLDWTKPEWGAVAGTNMVIPHHVQPGRGALPDSNSILRDPVQGGWIQAQYYGGGVASNGTLWRSANGIHNWTMVGELPPCGDRSTVYWDPFRHQFVFSIRAGGEYGGAPRHRLRATSPTIMPATWNPQMWCDASGYPVHPTYGVPPQLYNLDCVAYESLTIGLFNVLKGESPDRPKYNEICVGFSRDGVTWHQPVRDAFIEPNPVQGSWDYGNVQSVGGLLAVSNDVMGFWYSGRAGVPDTYEHGVCSMGLATMRRDGFASITGTGQLTTNVVVFTPPKRHLYVNSSAQSVVIEALDVSGAVVYAVSDPVIGNDTRHRVTFGGHSDISQGWGTPLRFRFNITNGELFSFWIGDDNGRSHGYLGGGGPEADANGRG